MIVIEGVDRFIDSENGKEANIAFWLPEYFPKNIKMIVTASKSSDAIEHLEKNNCEIVDIEPCKEIAEALLSRASEKETIVNKTTHTRLNNILITLKERLNNLSCLYSFIDSYCDCLIPSKNSNIPKDVQNVIKEVIEKRTPYQ